MVLGKGFVEGALGGGFVAVEGVEGGFGVVGVLRLQELGEDVGGGGVLVGDGAEGGFFGEGFGAIALGVGEGLLVFGDQFGVVGLGVLAGLLDGEVVEAGFGGCVSSELPGEECETLEEQLVEGGLGVELLAEGLFEEGEVGLFGVGDEGGWVEACAEGVGGGVEGGAGFAVGGAGACGFPGVGAVGCESFFGAGCVG
jgi:hypothetical protein